MSLARDGVEHADILGVQSETRWLIEVQVKTASYSTRPNWPVNLKAQKIAKTDREWFVLVALAPAPTGSHRAFIVPRDHVAAAAWISHMDWLTEPGIDSGKRNAGVDRARVRLSVFERSEDRWDLLERPTHDGSILLPPRYLALARSDRVGLPAGHPWRGDMPEWSE